MTDFKTKAAPVELKSADDGSISGYFSTFTRTPDSYGDVVAPGAFDKSFERINAEGGTVPLLWNHDADHLDSFIGTAGALGCDEHGAFFTATFDATPTAQRARELAMDGRLCKFSFAYTVSDQAEVELEDGTKANELREVDVKEISLVMYPANSDTSVTEVKSGRRNSASDEEDIRAAIALLQGVLGEREDNQGEDSGDAEPKANAEEPKANAEELESKRAALLARIRNTDR